MLSDSEASLRYLETLRSAQGDTKREYHDSKNVFLRDLGDGLILRRSTPADAEPLADFCGRIHSDEGPDKPDMHVAAWTRDLLASPIQLSTLTISP